MLSWRYPLTSSLAWWSMLSRPYPLTSSLAWWSMLSWRYPLTSSLAGGPCCLGATHWPVPSLVVHVVLVLPTDQFPRMVVHVVLALPTDQFPPWWSMLSWRYPLTSSLAWWSMLSWPYPLTSSLAGGPCCLGATHWPVPSLVVHVVLALPTDQFPRMVVHVV